LKFGTEVCGVVRPRTVLERIAQGMQDTQVEARGDARTPAALLGLMGPLWIAGMKYGQA
jgi:serine/threonine-protein kinase HipA